MRRPNSVAALAMRGALAPFTKSLSVRLSLALLLAVIIPLMAYAQAPTPGQNVNMVSGTKWPGGDPFLQRQNEPSIAVSTRNPQHLLAGANDYRTVDLNLVDQLPINQLGGDAWLGVFKSFDGGQRWQSTLLPGFPQDQSTFGTSSPMKGFAAASDPVVRAGTNGMFYYSSIALNRGTNVGALFLSRFIDLNNKENGDAAQSNYPGPTTDPIRYINTVQIDSGNAGQFIDKPWIAVDIPRAGAGTCIMQVPQDKGTTVTQTFPAGNVYMAYAMFVGGTINIRSKINFTKSSDCGNTWTKPIMISQTYDINQGTQVAVDPETGYVYVAWRTFSGSGTDPDAVVVAKSTDGGNTFSKAVPVRSLSPFNSATPTASAFFDENTSGTEFRTQSMPTIAVDDSGFSGTPGNVYVAWSERGVPPTGDARIMISTSHDGVTWSSPTPVDNGSLTDDATGQFTRGHQLMPAMTFIEGQLMLAYYDLRLDHTIGLFSPATPFPDLLGRFFPENRKYLGDAPSAVFTPFIDDASLQQRRHTIDVMLSQSSGGLSPTFTHARVSRYDFGLPAPEGNGDQFEQLKLNPPNLPMFSQGTVPFMGDYIDIAGQMFVPLPGGGWTFNNPLPSTASGSAAAAKPAVGSPVHYSAWTTNQDVIPPADGNWTKYFAISLGPTSVFNGQTMPACVAGFESDRNQNIYDSRITQGLLVTSPQNSKPLVDQKANPIQRAFAVLVQNSTSFTKYFQLTIANQPPGNFTIATTIPGQTTVGGYASFQQALPNQPALPSPLPAPVTTAMVAIGSHSGAVRSVFVLSNVVNASVSVNVNETDQNGNVLAGGLSSFLVLNADPSVVAALALPDGSTNDPNLAEIYDPNIITPNIITPNIITPNIITPNIITPNIITPNIITPNIITPNIITPNIQQTHVANPNIITPNIITPNIITPSLTDAVYTVTNNGNTNAGYRVKLAGGTKAPLQLSVAQVYMTPTSYQCTLIPQVQNVTLTNITSPEFTPVNQLGNPNIITPDVNDATINLAPGDSAQIVLRGPVDVPTMQQIVTQVAPVVVPQAVNTNSTATSPPVIAPLFITTASLPDGVASNAYSTTLSAIGGNLSPTCVGSWALTGAPAALSLSLASFTPGNPGISSVTLSGSLTAGTYTFTAQVQDCASPTPDTAMRQFTLRIAAPLVITTTSPLPTGTQGTSYGPVTLTATGGIQPLTWTTPTPAANLNGLTLSSSGVLSGTLAITGTFTFTVTVSDSASPAQSASSLMGVSVVPATPPAPPSSTLLCDTFNFASVTQQAGGPPTPTTCTLSNTTMITQVATYHFNGGFGAAPGTIALQGPGGLSFGPFTATGVAGQSGPNEAWVATPNVIVPAGTYTVIDSGSSTWSFNSGSNNSGFVREWGFAVQVNALTFVTQPSNTPVGQFISPSVQVKATDSSGAVLPFIAITISIGSNPSSGGTLSGTLTQTTDATGIATFNDLSINRTGGYTLLASSGNVFQRSLFFAVVDPTKPTFTGTQTGPNQWTYTLTFAPLVNYSIFPVATSNTNLTTITLTGLFGVTSAAGPTSTDFPSGGSPTDLNAINLNWSAAVLNGGTKVVYTHVGPGTGNLTDFRHAFGFTINASGAVNGTAPLATSGFSRDTTNALPDGTFKLDITATIDGPAPTASSMTVLATGVSTPPRSGGEALAANLATSNLFVKSLQDPAGSDLQFAQIAHDRTVTILGDFSSMVNSDASGIAVHPAGGIIVADEAGQRIALIGLSNPLTSSTLFNVPWKMNPSGNGTGQQRYAPILTQFGTGPTHLLLYFWDSTQSILYSVDALAPTTFVPLLSLDQSTAAGQHFATAGNHVVFDSNTGTLLLSDGSSNSVLEVNPASSPVTVTTLFSGLLAKPAAIALNAITNKVFVQIGNSIYVGPRSGGSLSLVQSGFTSLTDIVVGKATSGTGLSLFAVDKALNAVYEILVP